jgi:hypothetical protein
MTDALSEYVDECKAQIANLAENCSCGEFLTAAGSALIGAEETAIDVARRCYRPGMTVDDLRDLRRIHPSTVGADDYAQDRIPYAGSGREPGEFFEELLGEWRLTGHYGSAAHLWWRRQLVETVLVG